MADLQTFWEQIRYLFTFPLFEFGGTSVTLWRLLFPITLTALFIHLVNRMHHWLVNKLLTRSSMDIGSRMAIGALFRYTLLVLGFIIILQTTGIDLTVLNVLLGTLGVGVGFGLQNIVNNFISGLIILFERPIKVGDRIEVGNVHGQVMRIGARSSTILTNDNIAIIVPNLKFITENIVNWSHTDQKVRFRVPISVASDSDLYLVERLLLEAAREDADVLTDPAPGVRLLSFGDDGLHFELRAWSRSLIQRRGLLVSKLNYAIHNKFTAHNIQVPTPQQEIYLRSNPALEPDKR